MPIKPVSLKSVSMRLTAQKMEQKIPTSYPDGLVGVTYIPKNESSTGRLLVYVHIVAEISRLLDWVEQGGRFNLSMSPRSVVTIDDTNLRKLFKRVPTVKELVVTRFPDYAKRGKLDRLLNARIGREVEETEQLRREEQRKVVNQKSAATRKENASKRSAAEVARLARPASTQRPMWVKPQRSKGSAE